MRQKEIEVISLSEEHNYSILQGYSSHNKKIKLVCNSCKTSRELLAKSFIKNPVCKGCKKHKISNNKKNEKIIEMNISIRRKAKKIGFKINEWFDSTPKEVTVHCRNCNASYVRSLNSLRNGLVCFECRKGNIESPSPEDIDIPFIMDIVLKNKKINNLTALEKKVIRSINKLLTKEVKSNIIYDSKRNLYSSENISIFIKNTNYKKKFLLGNLLNKSNINHDIKSLASKSNYTLNELEQQYGINIFTQRIFKYYTDKLLKLSSSEVSELFNNLINFNYHININPENKINPVKSINFNYINKPSSLKVNNESNSLIIDFNNGTKFKLKIQQATKKTKLTSLDNLFQEVWSLYS